MKKLEFFWIGSKKGSNQIICSGKNLLRFKNGQMSRFKVMALGVWFCIDCEESKKKNCEEKVHKVEDILNNWRNKRLTLIGKISVIKALAASQLVPRLCAALIKGIFDSGLNCDNSYYYRSGTQNAFQQKWRKILQSL